MDAYGCNGNIGGQVRLCGNKGALTPTWNWVGMTRRALPKSSFFKKSMEVPMPSPRMDAATFESKVVQNFGKW